MQAVQAVRAIGDVWICQKGEELASLDLSRDQPLQSRTSFGTALMRRDMSFSTFQPDWADRVKFRELNWSYLDL